MEAQPAKSAEMSKLAVSAFVLSLIPCASPAGILCGVLAMLRIKRSNGVLRGRGFALAAVIIPLVALPLTVVAALPAFERYRCGAAQSEARYVLRALHAAEEGFRLEKGHYAANVTELGFAPRGEAHYAVRILDAAAESYHAEARMGADRWTVDERGAPDNVDNACE